MLMNSNEYLATIEQVKQEIKAAQYKAAVHVNTELIMLYHSIGCVINAHKIYGEVCSDIPGFGICATGCCTNSMGPQCSLAGQGL